MYVMTYPGYYSGDITKLPTVNAQGDIKIIPIEFGDYVDDELIDLFIKAKANACQWLELRNTPPVREEMCWRTLA